MNSRRRGMGYNYHYCYHTAFGAPLLLLLLPLFMSTTIRSIQAFAPMDCQMIPQQLQRQRNKGPSSLSFDDDRRQRSRRRRRRDSRHLWLSQGVDPERNDDSQSQDDSHDNRSNQNELPNASSFPNTTASLFAQLDNLLLQRFTSPRIDDRELPLTDAGMAQIVAPSLQLVWLSLCDAPLPTWVNAGGGGSTTLLLPVLLHGAGLAAAWLLGALAARAYERDALCPQKKIANEKTATSSKGATTTTTYSYANVLWKTCQAGSFAVGLLILATQVQLQLETIVGGDVGSIGSSASLWLEMTPSSSAARTMGTSGVMDDATMAQLLRYQLATTEVLQDVVFEAMTLIAWRLTLAISNHQAAINSGKDD